MDTKRSNELEEFNLLLALVNYTTTDNNQLPRNSEYNFSSTQALAIINEYLSAMFTMNQTSTIILVCLYLPVFIFSLVGNILVIFVVCRNRHMQRIKNLFLVNLAVADLAVTFICIPVTAGQIVFRLWVYGNVMCRVTVCLQGVAVICSIFTLTCLSVDRYLAIKGTPLRLQLWCGKSSMQLRMAVILLTTWVLACVCMAPLFAVRRVSSIEFPSFGLSVNYCIEEWPENVDKETYSVMLLVITFIVPMAIIIICYSLIGKTLCSDEFHRKMSDTSATAMLGRKRVARMLIALIALFVICWLPYNVVSLCLDLSYSYKVTHILPYTLWLGHAHSAINPVLYYLLNKSFRHCMRKAVSCTPIPQPSRQRQRLSPVVRL